MICPWCPWSACDRPYIYRGPRWKCAKKFVLVKIFRIGRPAAGRRRRGAAPARAAQVCPKITDLLKKIRFKSWVFVVFQGRLGAGDYIGIWYNLGIILEKFCLPPMICPWSAYDLPVNYRGLPSKCAKNFILVNFFRFGRPAAGRRRRGAAPARARRGRHRFVQKSQIY